MDAPTKQCKISALAEAQTEILRRFPDSVSPEMARALAVSDFVVDIASIRYLNKGFRFFSEKQICLEELLTLKIKSCWVGVVGDYNVGKTFFSVCAALRHFSNPSVVFDDGPTDCFGFGHPHTWYLPYGLPQARRQA